MTLYAERKQVPHVEPLDETSEQYVDYAVWFVQRHTSASKRRPRSLFTPTVWKPTSDVTFPPELSDFVLQPREAWDCVYEEFRNATTSTQRSMILEIYDRSMRIVAESLSSDARVEFDDAFLKSYRLLLITEALDGELIDQKRMELITAREVLAGRMREDDELRLLALGSKASNPQQGCAQEKRVAPKKRTWAFWRS